MGKFEKVNEALRNATCGTNNYVEITKNVEARHGGKYAIRNVETRNLEPISYNTLDEITKKYGLKI